MMWLTMIARNWQLALLALMTCAFTLSIAHGRYLKSELETKTAEIQLMRNAAKMYRDQSEITVKEISDAHQTLVEQVKTKDQAIKNAKARFGAYSALCPGAQRLPALYGDGQADRPESVDGPESERVVIDRPTLDACALDSGTLTLWQQWAMKNGLPVE